MRPHECEVTFVDAARVCWGAEESLLTLASEAKKHAGVRLICRSPDLAERWAREVSPTVQLSPPITTTRWWRVGDIYWCLRQWRQFRRKGCYVFFSYHLVVAAPLLRALNRRSTLVLDLHDRILGRRGVALLRFFARRLDVVLAISRYVAEPLKDVPVRQLVLYRPVRERPISTAHPAGRFAVGVLGQLAPHKGHQLVLDAFAHLTDRFTLVFRGGPGLSPASAYVDNLRRAGALLLGSRFRIAPRTHASHALEDIDVCVVANAREPLGRTVAESQIAGVLAVVPNAGGAAELVESGETGMIYEADCATDLARVLRLLADDNRLCAAIRVRAREVALERHAAEPYARKYLAAVFRLASSDNCAPGTG